MMTAVLMVFGVMSVATPGFSQSKKKQWCCTLGSKVAAFRSEGKKTKGKIRHICLDSKSRPNSPSSIYVKKCNRVRGAWRVTPDVGQIQIVENYARKSNSVRSARKVNKKTRTYSNEAKDPSLAKKSKAKKKKVASKVGGKKKTKTKAKVKAKGTKVAKKKTRGKTGAKPKKKKKKKVKKTTKKKASSDS